jgi:hypothetical protein
LLSTGVNVDAEIDLPLSAWFGAAFDLNTMAVFNRQPDLKRITFLKIGTRHAGQVQFRCDCDARFLQRTDHHSIPKIRNQGAGLPPLFKGCDKPYTPGGRKNYSN